MALWEPINGVYTATAPLFPWVASLPSFDTGEWGSAVISAAFGAYFGAWMAGRIARNTKLRDELLAELRAIDVATTLCTSVVNVAMSLKKQHVLKLLQSYETELQRFKDYKAGHDRSVPFVLKADHMRLQTLTPPIADLHALVIRDMSISPNGVKSASALAEALDNLNGLITGYNALLDMFRNETYPPGFKFENYYFGIPVKGIRSTEYDTAVRGIATYTNDVIFFAMKLAGCLTERGVKVRDQYQKLSGERRLVRRINIPKNDSAAFVPSDEDYAQWMTGWEPPLPDPVKLRWWHCKRM